MNSLTIGYTTIHQDEHGRYSLSDLYHASGSLPKNKPSEWMRNKQTQALIDELISEQEFTPRNRQTQAGILAWVGQSEAGIAASVEDERSGNSCFAPVVTIRSGNTRLQGTYVVKELVYTYAMWISPTFNLKVIRAYDDLMRGETAAEKRKSLAAWRAHLKKYPQDGRIRDMAEQGEPYWFIAQMVKLVAATVGKRIKRMIEWGFMDEARLRSIRSCAAPIRELRRQHFHQLGLF